MGQAVYTRRSNLFEKGEWTWSVTEAGIHETDPRGRENLIRWDDISRIRLAYAPTRYKPWRYLVELKLNSGGKLSIDNVHFKGVADFEDRSGAYRPFVVAMLDELRRRRPGLGLQIGSTPVSYWVQMALVAVVFAVLAAVLIALPGVAIPGIVWVKFGLIAFSLPVLFLWARRSYPRKRTLDDVPETALPRAA